MTGYLVDAPIAGRFYVCDDFRIMRTDDSSEINTDPGSIKDRRVAGPFFNEIAAILDKRDRDRNRYSVWQCQPDWSAAQGAIPPKRVREEFGLSE